MQSLWASDEEAATGYLKASIVSFCEAKTSTASFCEAKISASAKQKRRRAAKTELRILAENG